MVRPSLRTRKIVKKIRRTPSGKRTIIFRKKKTNKARCPDTGQVLHGTAYGRKRDVRNLSKTQKRPSRYYGGVLSPRALKNRIVEKIHELMFSE